MSKQIYHEAPIYYFDQVQELTDGDYCLVHLCEENDEYYNKFTQALSKGRNVILDNSIFELGVAFDKDKFLIWNNQLEPSEYIIPDVLEDTEATVASAKAWDSKLAIGKSIGVIQGKTYEELKWCYQEIEPLVDKVAISFDYSYYIVHPTIDKLTQWVAGRQQLIQDLVRDDIINQDKPHHLLGAAKMSEFSDYRDMNFIESIDTSNPVMVALDGQRYNGLKGIDTKPETKLFTLMNYKPESEQIDLDNKARIEYNIKTFREICNG